MVHTYPTFQQDFLGLITRAFCATGVLSRHDSQGDPYVGLRLWWDPNCSGHHNQDNTGYEEKNGLTHCSGTHCRPVSVETQT